MQQYLGIAVCTYRMGVMVKGGSARNLACSGYGCC